MTPALAAPGFWRTLALLLRYARKRSVGHRLRQRALMSNKLGRTAGEWNWLWTLAAISFAIAVHVSAAYLVIHAVTAGERVAAEHAGYVSVDDWFVTNVNRAAALAKSKDQADLMLADSYAAEAKHLAEQTGGNAAALEGRLRNTVRELGAVGFVAQARIKPGLTALPTEGVAAVLGSPALLCWSVMLVLQGEGLELDVQQRRQPMWEWLFSHPVPQGAVFLAEMLAPLAANPVYWAAPLLPGILYGRLYGWRPGLLTAIIAGIPISLAAACLGKAIEIGLVLRCRPRSRGALAGALSWAAFAALMLIFILPAQMEMVASAAAGLLLELAKLPWPWLGLLLGQRSDGSFSLPAGLLTCDTAAVLVCAASVGFSVWSARQGLAGRIGRRDTAPTAVRAGQTRFGRGPLYRKELLWLSRDRSVIVQVVLLPLTMVSVQAFNMRGLVFAAGRQWNFFCGVAIVLGTYFLVVIGPKSLTSEGKALWLALTWPRGLESLLRAKAWLWACIASVLVGLVLAYAAYRFPENRVGVALVGLGWLLFARSMADKAVTLAVVVSESGERQRVSRGRQAATLLGTLTFGIGVFTRQWPLAMAGIVYSTVTAAAMWQNFRARLPFLFDPWSERLPEPPTTMHAMIAISGLVEATAVVTGLILAVAPRGDVAAVRALAYTGCSAATALAVASFLNRRGVSPAGLWTWPGARLRPNSVSLLIGAACGVLLGLFGRGYVELLHRIPWTAAPLSQSEAQLHAVPHLWAAYFVTAVLVAPLAEEYLFRGLLFRALDREWRSWQAVAGSAAFFAIYHPTFAWFPVGAVGVANAVLFKRTGRLAPAVLLHAIYNAVVLA